MRRRDFIAGLAGAAALPRGLRAQQAKPVVGVLHSGALPGYRDLLVPFQRGLAELGFVDGETVDVQYRWAEGKFERLPDLAAELVRSGARILVARGISCALAARAASPTTPLVFLSGDNPVRFGLVASLDHPGGMTTGVAWLASELFTKRLELLRQLVPEASVVGVLVNPNRPEVELQLKEIEAAAHSMGQTVKIMVASDETDLDASFAAQHIDSLVVNADSFFNSTRARIIALAARYRVPAIYSRREFPEAGGLASYGTDYLAAYRELGVYVGRILKGAKPSDLPIEHTARYELVFNMKVARALGLDVPSKMLAQADTVIR